MSTATQRRVVVTGETRPVCGTIEHEVIVYSQSDPGGFRMWKLDCDLAAYVSHMAGQGYAVEGASQATPPAEDEPEADAGPIRCRLPLDSIRVDGGTQVRCRICEETVHDYAEQMAFGVVFPPAVAFEDEQGVVWLADGFHRYAAARCAGLPDLVVEVRDGTLKDALLYACGANTEHGLRRTNADKRRAVAVALDEWPDWSDRQLAAACNVSHTYVGNTRRELHPGPAVNVASPAPEHPAPPARDEAPAQASLPPARQAAPSYPSERQEPAPRPAATPLPSPRREDDRTPDISVRTWAEACWTTLTALREHGGPIRDREAIAIIAQRFADFRRAVLDGRI